MGIEVVTPSIVLHGLCGSRLCRWRDLVLVERAGARVMARRLVVTGTRHGRPDVWDALNAWFVAFGHGVHVVVYFGDAHGVDAVAERWATEAYKGAALAGVGHRVVGHRFPADWAKGRRAGPEPDHAGAVPRYPPV